jgi:hypothetical protein
MGRGAGAGELLADEQPAGTRLKGDVDLLVGKAPNPTAHRLASRRDAPGVDLSAGQVKGVEGDLCSMQVEADYDRHGVSSLAPALPIRASFSR